MVNFQTIEIAGFAPAIAGMRHPLKSYDKADSAYDEDGNFHIGKNDYLLAKRLCQAGSPEHAKFLRQICVWVNITAPRYWWSEFDTYKVGTTANSQSTMHRLMKDGVTNNDIDFPWDFIPAASLIMEHYIYDLNNLIHNSMEIYPQYNSDKSFLELVKAMLPEGYKQTRLVSLNYQVLRTMYGQRKNHRLSGWSTDFVDWIKTLPLPEWITGDFPDEDQIFSKDWSNDAAESVEPTEPAPETLEDNSDNIIWDDSKYVLSDVEDLDTSDNLTDLQSSEETFDNN